MKGFVWSSLLFVDLLTGFSSACMSNVEICSPKTASDLDAVVARHQRGDFCDSINVVDTDLTGISAMRGLGVAPQILINQNEALTDFRGFADVDVFWAGIYANHSANEIRIGPLSATTLSIRDNGVSTISVSLDNSRSSEATEVAISEGGLGALRIDGNADSVHLLLLGAVAEELAVAIPSNLFGLSIVGVEEIGRLEQLQAFGVPSAEVSIYGGIGADGEAVDAYLNWLQENGFDGRFRACRTTCSYSPDSPCREPVDDSCVVYP